MTLEEATEALYGFRDHLVDVTIALSLAKWAMRLTG